MVGSEPLLGSLPKNPGPQSKPDSSFHDTQFIKLVILPCDLQAFFFFLPKLLEKKLIKIYGNLGKNKN